MIVRAWAVLAVLMCASCATAVPEVEGPPIDAECVDNAGCEVGEICDASYTCRVVGCLASDECPFGGVCDPTTYSCVAGCETDRDCLASERCDAGTCVERGCSDTHRDCAVGEVCRGGSCQLAAGSWCQDCTGRPLTCGQRQQCVAFGASSDAFCFTRCGTEADCPSGFECLSVDLDPGGPTRLCYANCGFLTDNGFF